MALRAREKLDQILSQPSIPAACAKPARPRLWQQPRFVLFAYLASVIGITFIHTPALLSLLLGGAICAAGPKRWHILRRTIMAVIAFNLSVSIGYLLISLWLGNFVANYLLLVNLRVLLLVFLGFWFTTRINLLAALAGWPTATLLATLAIGQIKTFERIIADFRFAFNSRNLAPPSMLNQCRCAAAQAQTLMDKSLASSSEVALAMRSRGSFDD